MVGPFELNDLPDDSWSVCWPGYEQHVVNNPRKIDTLLDILFETVKVFEARLAVSRQSWSHERHEILYISHSAYWQDKYGLMQFLSDFIVIGVQFQTLNEAQHFKTHLEQRLAWRRLGGEWQ